MQLVANVDSMLGAKSKPLAKLVTDFLSLTFYFGVRTEMVTVT